MISWSTFIDLARKVLLPYNVISLYIPLHFVSFFHKNLFYKNFEAEINQNYKDVLKA